MNLGASAETMPFMTALENERTRVTNGVIVPEADGLQTWLSQSLPFLHRFAAPLIRM